MSQPTDDTPNRTPAPTAAQIARHVAAFEANRDRPAKPDNMDDIRAWAASLREQAAEEQG